MAYVRHIVSQAIPQHKTTVGKGRAFIRYNLKVKTLAEHVQVACRNAKVTRQFYQRDAVLRHEQQSSQLVDILYNLNVVDFQLESKLSLDDAWPAFAEKRFGDAPPMATRTTAISTSYGGGVGVHGDAVSLVRTTFFFFWLTRTDTRRWCSSSVLSMSHSTFMAFWADVHHSDDA